MAGLPCPAVALLVSENAQAIALKNGVRFDQLLAPFSTVKGADALVRSVSKTYRLRDFTLRWLDVATLAAPKERDVTEALVAAVAEGDAAVDTDPVPPRKGSPLFSEWFAQFHRELNMQLRCQEHEMFEQPVAMVFVASSTDVDPVATFDELAAARRLPRAFTKRHYDGAIPRFHVLLHDVGEGDTTPSAETILRRMKSTFLAPNCKLLKINSVPSPLAPDHDVVCAPTLWKGIVPIAAGAAGAAEGGAAAAPPLGAHLDAADLTAIAEFIADLSVKHVLPTMERRMFQLNSEITAARKGFKNALKSWWRKPKTDVDTKAGPQDVRYPHDSIESRIRLLADYAFMLQDYAMAMQFYRMVEADFKADRALLHRGGVLRMMCHCSMRLDEPATSYVDHAKQAVSALRQSASHESAVGTSGAMLLLLRAQLLLVDALLAAAKAGATQLRRAADELVKTAEDKPDTFAALLLEQAAACYGLSATPQRRKHAFHMVRAGHLYRTSAFNRHAARCHNLAAAVYSGGGWHRIEDHVNSALWKEARAFGDDGASTSFLRQLLRDGRRSAERQRAYMNDYLQTTAAECAAAEAEGSERRRFKLDLALPTFDDDSLIVELQDNACAEEMRAALPSASPGTTKLDASSIDATLTLGRKAQTAESWLRLREALAIERESSPESGDWTEHDALLPAQRRKKRRAKASAKSRAHALGERIVVCVDVCNPLAIPLELSDIALRSHLDGVAVPAVEGGDERVEIESQSLTLAPQSTATLRLALVPRALGELQIIGLQWKIAGQIWGRKDFELKGVPLNDTRDHRADGSRIPDRRLHAAIVAPRPWLGITLDGVPEEMLDGEICRATMTLRNCSEVAPITNLGVICSAPIISVGGSDSESDGACLDPIGITGRVLPLSACESIAPGASSTISLWLRAPALGSQHVAMLFRFDGDDCPFREVQIALALRTKPSLQITTSVLPSARVEDEMLLQLRANNGSDVGIDIAAVGMLSTTWKANSLGSSTVRSLQSGEGMGLVARLSAHAENSVCGSALAALESSGAPAAVAGAIADAANWSLCAPIINLVALANAELLVGKERARVYRDEALKDAAAAESGPSSIQGIRRDNQGKTGEEAEEEIAAVPLPWTVDALWKGATQQQPSPSLHLAVLWKSNSEDAERWGVIPLLSIPTDASSHAPLSESLSLSAHFESDTVHDFATESVLAIPFTITLVNSASTASDPIAFVVDFVPPGESLGEATPTTTPRPWLRWAGKTRQRVESLAPGASIELAVHALVSQPGIYDLNRVRLTSSGETVLFAGKTFLVTVESPVEL